MAINGVTAGKSGRFVASEVPAGAIVPNPPQWLSDNPLAVVTQDIASDPRGLTVNVDVDASATGSFNLTINATRSDGVVATGTVNVPILAPAPAEVTSFTIDQI